MNNKVSNLKAFDLQDHSLTKYLFFTGKGGVGKTSLACAIAIGYADQGHRVLLISTDPASNLQDIFGCELTSQGVAIEGVEHLYVANLDPIKAAEAYKESVIAPYRGKLPDAVLHHMEEQLSGSCTIEIAAFNEFSNFITNKEVEELYDYIIFDTAPTGHTLRMLQLPSAWSQFISESTHGASCLGQLSGLEEKKEVYKQAVETLADKEKTTLILVARAEESPLKEAARASQELALLGIHQQMILINGVLEEVSDEVSMKFHEKQQVALSQMPKEISTLPMYSIALRGYHLAGIPAIRNLLSKNTYDLSQQAILCDTMKSLQDVIDDLDKTNKKIIFTMGKGGVGKTTIAAAIALGLRNKGKKVHLTTTDPAAHVKLVLEACDGMMMSHIDEQKELLAYQEEVLSHARTTMSEEDIAYIEEDLRSPCTQEIAVFRAFAQIVDAAKDQVVVIDTAPTGHTLLLLDATQSYHREVQRTQGEIPEAVKQLLPRLTSEETQALIVTLPEATPCLEALRLEEDLHRAHMKTSWWIINASLYATQTKSPLLQARANNEVTWIQTINEHTSGSCALVKWKSEEVKNEQLLTL